MKEIKKLVLESLYKELLLAKAMMQYGNNYVFGSDDVFNILDKKINELE